MEHVFPQIIKDQGKVFVLFSRKNNSNFNAKVPLEELDETIEISEISNNEKFSDNKKSIYFFTKYFKSALKLLINLRMHSSLSLDYQIVKFYDYDALTEAINVCSNKNITLYEIRLNLSEVKDLFFHNFFTPTFTKFPNTIQLVDQNEEMTKTMNEIKSVIEMNLTTASTLEDQILNLCGIKKEHLIQSETKNKKSNDPQELNKTIASVNKLDTDNDRFITEASVLLRSFKKLLVEKDSEIPFVRECHSTVLNWIARSTQTILKERQNHAVKNIVIDDNVEFILEALIVFTIIEEKIIEIGSTEIIQLIESSKVLSVVNQVEKLTHEDSHHQIHSKIEKLLHPVRENWKKRVRLYQKSSNSNIPEPSNEDMKNDVINKVEQEYEHYYEEGIKEKLLKVIQLKDDTLTSEIINQLMRVSSFENKLIKAMQGTVLLNDENSLKKVKEVITSCIQLNFYSRGIQVATEQRYPVSKEVIEEYISKTNKMLWGLFFAIYNPVQHFRREFDSTSPEDRFMNIFLETNLNAKHVPFRIVAEAIDSRFQQIFHILKVPVTLLRTLKWLFKINLQ